VRTGGSIVACKTCGLLQRLEALQPGTAAECFRCGSAIASIPSTALGARTGVLAFGRADFFVPANIYPILLMDSTGPIRKAPFGTGA